MLTRRPQSLSRQSPPPPSLPASLPRTRHDHAGQRGLAGKLAVHVCLAFHLSRARAEAHYSHFDTNLIARRHGTPEFGAVDAGENRQLRMPVLQLRKQKHRSCLRHRLHDQHAGHQRMAGEVALKKRLVHGHVLDGDHALRGSNSSMRSIRRKGYRWGRKSMISWMVNVMRRLLESVEVVCSVLLGIINIHPHRNA